MKFPRAGINWFRHPLGSLTLQKKMGLLVLAGLTVGLVLLSWLGIQSVGESVERTLHERLTIAREMAGRLDTTLTFALLQVQSAANANDGLPPKEHFRQVAEQTRETLAKLGIATQNIFLVDKAGAVLDVEPQNLKIADPTISLYPNLSSTIESGISAISDLVSSPSTEIPVVFITAPVSSKGKIAGALVVSIDMENSSISAFKPSVTVGKTGYTEIVDGNGIVLARTSPGFPPAKFEKSDHPGRFAKLISQGQATVGTCHRCHETDSGAELERRQDVLAFAPLSTASWGVAIRQSEEEALAPTQRLERSLLLLGTIFLASMLLLVWAMMQAIVKPLRMLTTAAKRVAGGDFTVTMPLHRGDEIGQLSMAFHTMTEELTRARDKLVSRYKEAKHKEQIRGQLLSSVINAQEEERKRIARELHDEHGQTLSGLILSIESMESMTPLQPQLKDKLKATKLSLIRAVEDIRRLTLNLRPSSLDDLGLPAAVRAYAANRLGVAGIQMRFESKGISERLDPDVETAIFRIVQEAINNIVKHAKAHNVTVKLTAQESKITAAVEDDGQGFDVESAFATKIGTTSLGLLGIKERTTLLDGTFTINSRVGEGTRLVVEVPLVMARPLAENLPENEGSAAFVEAGAKQGGMGK
ncbi:MAG: HAMP domain-containing protein [Chloroflexi bacterium]|nr:HAMP domain-containing protein [Chloroflexota bacterium]